MQTIILDFETSYLPRTPPGQKPHGLRSQTVPEYLHDSRTIPLGAAVSINGRRAYVTPDKLPVVLQAIVRQVSNGATLSAHNAAFDLSVWSRFWPETYQTVRQALAADPLRLIDTEHLARYASANGWLPHTVGSSIHALGEHYQLEKGDTAEAVAAGGQRLAAYAIRDVEIAERVISDFAADWPERENALSTLHVLMGTPGATTLYIDADALRDTATEPPQDAERKKKLRKNDLFVQALERLGVAVQYKTTATGRRAPALAKFDGFMRSLLVHENPRVQRLAEMRLDAGSNIDRTRARTLLTASANGTRPLPLPLRYFAAHTGRSGGTDGMNVQNMPRGGVHRRSLIPPLGHRLVVADASQIEVRVLAWMAGDHGMLDVFRRGADPYKAFAVDLYGLDSEDAVAPEQRRVAKSAVLGLGFGAGAGGFVNYCKTMGVDITDSEAQSVVHVYRKSRASVPRYWRQLEREVRNSNQVVLPSGRRITYPENTGREFTRPRPFNKTGGASNLWGGLITENAVQATARDITLLHHAVDIAARWPVVLLVHDEIVCCVPEQDANDCLADMLDVMSVAPDWAEGLPLAAEGTIATNYGEAK